MTDPRDGRRTQLIIWAAGEARRLRQEEAPEETLAGPATPSTADPQVEGRLAADVQGIVLDWQLLLEPAQESNP
jgi:hypothetical protein